MRRSLYRMLAIALAAAPLLLAAGCATHEPTPVTVVPMPEPIPPAPLHVSVEWVSLDHAVVSRVDGYRHVISDEPVAVAAAAHEDEDPLVTKPLVATPLAQADDGDENADQSASAEGVSPLDAESNSEAQRREATTSAERGAWSKFCSGESLSEQEDELVAATRMPTEMKGSCDAGWHGEK